jgi:dTDP-4-dehydrorhamnose 3,5-epimerase-like enzyme
LKFSIKDCYIIKLPKIEDKRGNISFFENEKHIPFKIKRSYWIYDVPGGAKRGGHAYKELQEFVIAISGSFDIHLDDVNEKKIVTLNRSYYGLYIPNNIWRSLENFSTNAVCLVVASEHYSENDYIRGYKEFLKGNQYD